MLDMYHDITTLYRYLEVKPIGSYYFTYNDMEYIVLKCYAQK